MCTMIVKQIAVAGSGKGAGGWFTLRHANVSYDHPFNAPLEHALDVYKRQTTRSTLAYVIPAFAAW